MQFAKDQVKQADVDKNKFENRLAKANKIVKSLCYKFVYHFYQVSNLVPAWLSKIRQIFEKNKIDADLQVTLITPYLTGRVREILQNHPETDLASFDALAERLKVEYGLTPAVNKFNFDNATRASEETFTQFCSRLTNLLATYLASKKVENYDQLCQLLIVDRLKSILPLAAKMFLVDKEIDGENLTSVRAGNLLDTYEGCNGRLYTHSNRGNGWKQNRLNKFSNNYEKKPQQFSQSADFRNADNNEKHEFQRADKTKTVCTRCLATLSFTFHAFVPLLNRLTYATYKSMMENKTGKSRKIFKPWKTKRVTVANTTAQTNN